MIAGGEKNCHWYRFRKIHIKKFNRIKVFEMNYRLETLFKLVFNIIRALLKSHNWDFQFIWGQEVHELYRTYPQVNVMIN